MKANTESNAALPLLTEEWEKMRTEARHCKACPLWENGTQTVFGEGRLDSKLVMVGEQPGDQEDLSGRPFVGPAGKLLDRALKEAGIPREEAYVTNAVKHFKWEPRGKRRLHQKPNSREMAACKPWLEAELLVIRPKVLLCLGATAAATVLGSNVRVLRDRGRVLASEYCAQTLVTVHPSSLLRAPDEESRREGMEKFIDDLRMVARLLEET